MRIFIAFLFSNLLFEFLPAQQTYFNNYYEVSGYTNYTSSVIQKSDSGYIFINTDVGPVYKSFGFVNVNKFGDTLYSKNYYYQYLLFSSGVTHSLIQTQDGNYLVSGSVMDTSNTRQGWLAKFDPNGDTLWTRYYGGVANDYINSLYEDAQGDVWGCGSTSSWGNGLSDFWLVHFDANGLAIWDTTFGTNQSEGCVSGELTDDGGIIMAGRTNGSPYVVKVDAAGNSEWQFAYPNYSGYGYISTAADSGYIVGCGEVISAAEAQAAILKLNSDGTLDWVKHVGFVGVEDIITTKPVVSDSNIVVSGVSTTATSGYYTGFLAKTDIQGYMLWQRTYTLDSMHSHHVYECLATSDGGYLLGGSTFQSTQNAWLVKVDSLGCEVAGCDAVGISELNESNNVSVYPNPANNLITIEIGVPDFTNSTFELFSSTGQLVKSELIVNDLVVQINVADLEPGLYFYRLSDQTDKSYQGCVLITH